jgi:transcriptional regulator with XRE-family HTH domain
MVTSAAPAHQVWEKLEGMYHRSSQRAISTNPHMHHSEPPAIPPNRLKELREAAGLTQQRLGELIGVKHATVNRWEHRVNAISNRYLHELAKVLRCHPGEILAPLPKEKGLTPTQKKVRRISETWDDESLARLLEIAAVLHRRLP